MEGGGGNQNHHANGKSGGNGLSWDIWDLGSWGAFHHAPQPISSSSSSAAAFFHPDQHHHYPIHTISSLSSSFFPCHHGGRGGRSGDAQHHLTCLKLGKRQYYEEGNAAAAAAAAAGDMKRERVVTAAGGSSSSSGAMVMVPRCQVEGCNVALVDAKDYHRRHKVCEKHSKAPKVVVLGREQRFCQQCSRFHVISEFDDSKRSCRRRLAGHNERRRKSSSTTESIIRNPSSLDNPAVLGGRLPYISPSTTPERALSLLSSKAGSWVSSDLSSRSSAALRELIAENRAALLARQLFSDRGWHNVGPGPQAALSYMPPQHSSPLEAPPQLPEGWEHFHGADTHVTLDLMQMPGSSFQILSGRSKSKEEEEECCEIWNSLEGTHVV